jgi:endonuclease/exonuclease/phosphatase (EEP) superfamily protein YafD
MPSTPLRLVTWNCCRLKNAHRLPEIETLSPDVLIVQEARDPEAPAWCEVRPNLGIAVHGGNGVEFEPVLELANDAALLVRARRQEFSIPVLAIWALPSPTYADAVLRSLTTAMEALPGEDLIIAGDFNLSPAVANRRDSTRAQQVFAEFSARGYKSAYHSHRACAFGSEPDATHFFRRDPERPFHIDYCFVPQAWERVAVSIPSDGPIVALSDHRPLVVTVAR